MLKIDVSTLLMPTSGVNIDLGAVDPFDGQLQAAGGILWLLRDEFTTDLAAGAVNGTAAEPGPGTRTVVDTENKVTIANGKLTFAGGKATPAWGDPFVKESSRTRVPGLITFAQFSQPTEYCFIGLLNSDGTSIINAFKLQAQTLNAWSSGTGPAVGTYVYNTNYILAVILRATGAHYYIKGGVFTNWTLVYISTIDSTATVYPGISQYSGGLTSDFIRVPTLLWLPSPLLSTSGAMTWPLTNGLGHAETTGLGSGGSGLTLLDAGTWSVAGGYVLNTPGVGVEMIVDPGFDDATKWTAGTGWAVAGSQAAHTGGVNAAIVDNSGTQSIVGQWYECIVNLVAAAGNTWIGPNTTDTMLLVNSPTGQRLATMRATVAARPAVAATADNTVSSFSCKPLPISNLITNTQLSTTDILAEEVIHARTAGTQVGMALNLDRSFAAKCAATAAAGQRVISLKEVTSGQELVQNGGFDSTTTGWTPAASATASSISGGQSGNCLKVTNGAAAYGFVDQVIPTIVGKAYTLTLYAKNGTASIAYIQVGTGAGNGDLYDSGAITAADWTKYTINFTATTTTTHIDLYAGGNTNGVYSLYDSVSIIEHGLSTFDTLTIAGTTYTIASISGGSNVAYDDTAKTQTVTLGADLGAQVAVNDKVGVDWAAWNGVMAYFDGAGNCKLDEIKGGVYTNRISAAVTFVADKRLITRKIGTSYYVFFNEALVGSTTAVDAAAQVGKYHGMFSTLAANTITSLLIYYVGSNGEYNANLNTFST